MSLRVDLFPGLISMTGGKNLVIVEDDPDIRLLLERCLRADGYHVTSLGAAAGLDELLSVGGVALVIVDVGLPDADGLTITRRIRQHHPSAGDHRRQVHATRRYDA